MIGYASLLNIDAQPHWTIFLTDFSLEPEELRRIGRQLQRVETRPLFIRIDQGLAAALQKMRAADVDIHRDYVSLQAVVLREDNLKLVRRLFDRLTRRDLARVEVPSVASRQRRRCAMTLLTIVMRSDYAQQEDVASRFFRLLEDRDPYQVVVTTPGGTLEIRDTRPWFELAGRLRPNETRLIPDGEVSYSGDGDTRVEGEFVVDGAILPIAQGPRFAAESLRLMRWSREVSRHPFRLRVRGGKVVDISGNGRLPSAIARLFEASERYRHVNEVGIAFNRASTRFIHTWPAASNEVRPGVHLGLGGAANPDAQTSLIHLDCIAANCAVFVNGHPFLNAGSRSGNRRVSRAAARA